MKKKTICLLVCLSFLVSAVALLTANIILLPLGVTEDSYSRIREGMSRQQVEAILGSAAMEGPGGIRDDEKQGRANGISRLYKGTTGDIWVLFDLDDKVTMFGTTGFKR